MNKQHCPAIVLVLAAALTVPVAAAETRVTTRGGFKVESGDFSFKLGGRIQSDWYTFDGVYNRSETRGLNNEDVVTGSDISFRRVRLTASGDVARDWKYKIQYDFVSEDLQSAYLQYTGFGPKDSAIISVGKHQVPVGLDDNSNSNEILALERSAPSLAFAFGKLMGLSLHGYRDGPRIYYRVGIYEAEQGDSNDTDILVAGRIAFSRQLAENSVWHFGASYALDESEFLGATRPEVHPVTSANRIQLGEIDYNGGDILGLEFAGTAGPLHWQVEFFDVSTDGIAKDDPSDVTGQRQRDFGGDVDGFSAQLSYSLTGHSRPYSEQKAAFGAPKPSGDTISVELYARYSELNLSTENSYGMATGATANSFLRDGWDSELLTVGISWWFNENIRINAQYSTQDATIYDGTNPTVAEDGDSLAVRFQVTF